MPVSLAFAPCPQPELASEASASGGSGSVLLVDDDPEIREALNDILASEGYAVSMAMDGLAALAHLESSPVDAIVLDLGMPKMDGRQFLAVRASKPHLAKIPVVVVSASSRKPRKMPGTVMLSKPIDVDALLSALSRACYRRPS